MGWNPTTLSLLAFVAAGILAVLAGVGLRRRQNAAQRFTALMTAATCWVLIYGVQLGFTTAAEQLFWQRITLAVSGTVPPLFLFFAYQYAGNPDRLTGRVEWLLAGEAIVFAGFALTNPFHHLVWTRATLHSRSLSPVLELQFGTGYFVHIVFAYLVVALALWTILSVYFRSGLVYRRQAALLLVGTVPAFVAHVLFTGQTSPIAGLDFTPFVFAFTGVTYGLALFHFDLLERTPVAHQRAIELTGDGLLVVDAAGLIVDCNRVARQVYGIDRTGETHVSTVIETPDLQQLDGTTTTGIVDGSKRVYDLYVSKLTDESGLHAGSAIVLRDVTDRDAYEQRLEVANRVLRHNLRNDMNVILGYVDLLSERASSAEQERLAGVVRTKAEDLVTLSEKAHQMVDIQKESRADPERVDIVSVLDPLVAEFREAYPEVAVTVDRPDEADAAIVSKRALTIALRNLIENAAEHNDTADLTVEIAVTTEDGRTRIRVSDDGSGLPEMEQAVLQKHTETPLEHSSGLGLWLTYWVVSTTGGEISVDASEGRGTSITLTFQRQQSSPAEASDDGGGTSSAATATVES